MTLVFTVLTMVVLGLVSAVAVGRLGGGLDAPVSSLPSRGLPDGLPPGHVTDADLEAIRFAPALRGYRMDEVDALVDRLAAELRHRDAELEQLRARLEEAGRGDPGSFWPADDLARPGLADADTAAYPTYPYPPAEPYPVAPPYPAVQRYPDPQPYPVAQPYPSPGYPDEIQDWSAVDAGAPATAPNREES